MPNRQTFLWPAIAVAAMLFATRVATAQSAQQLIQQVVDVERAADRDDHSNWAYLEEIRKPKEHLFQWVVTTQHGNVDRPLEKNDQIVSEPEQRQEVEDFLRNPKAQSKQLSESAHDNQQVDDLLKLLPAAFVWTQTASTSSSVTLHFEPSPTFHPPTREARVFGGMTGDLVADTTQHRILSMHGHLIREVTFGGGLLGKLKEGSTFSLEQAQVGPALWQLTEIHVHLVGSALLFKSISLEQDDTRSSFEREPDSLDLGHARDVVMQKPADKHLLQNASR